MHIRILVWLAVLPSILLAKNVLSYDRIEKEPVRLLVWMFVLGMLTCVPAVIIEVVGETAITHLTTNATALAVLIYLILVPVAEEGVKYVALTLVRNNPEFNYTFDGIVYGVMVGLGFAILENVLYVLDSMSVGLAVMRGMLSVPLHCCCGIFMGYYVGVARGQEVRGIAGEATRAQLLALIVPCLIHGLYDFSLAMESVPMLLLGLAFTVAVFLLAARQVKAASASDMPISPDIWSIRTAPLPHRGVGNRNGRRTPPPPFNMR